MEQVNDTMRAPAAGAAGAVRRLDHRLPTMLGFHPGEHVGMPSRHLTFVISFDAPLELAVLPDGPPPVRPASTPCSAVCTRPGVVIRHDGNQHGIMLAVTPAGARALFGLPAGALASRRRAARRAVGAPRRRAARPPRRDAGIWAQRFAVVERVLLRALTARVEVPVGRQPETTEAWRRLE